ncbi:MAG: hypothetical protein ACOCWZ_07140 [Spirochaetota bacterium]
MQILVFSDNKGINKPFTRLIKSKEITVHFFSPSEIKKVLKNTAHGSILYVDISDMSPDERAKMMKYLARLENYRYGIIDRKNIIHDVAELFHNNACDYMGKELLKEEIAPKRIKTIETYRAMQLPDEEQNPAASNYILSGNNWNNIKTGQEYTFCMMFIELDNQKELMKNMGASHIEQTVLSFRKYLEKYFSPLQGQIWMWMDFGGLILFPFDAEKCDAILASFRMILNRQLICIEEIDINTTLSFKIALNIGNTVYRKKGDTGNIISDSINSIFHLGQKYTPPGNFYLTREVFEYAPAGLKKMFLDAGEYEGREILRMRLPE